jgi:hypothetical protein
MDIRKIQRPERSGLISCLIAYFLLCSVCEMPYFHQCHFLGGKPSLLCVIAPWECLCQPPKLRPRMVREEVNYVTLDDPFYKGPLEKRKRRDCVEDEGFDGRTDEVSLKLTPDDCIGQGVPWVQSVTCLDGKPKCLRFIFSRGKVLGGMPPANNSRFDLITLCRRWSDQTCDYQGRVALFVWGPIDFDK